MKIMAMPGYLVAEPVRMEEKKTVSGLIVPVGEKKRGRLEETQRGIIRRIFFKDEHEKDYWDNGQNIWVLVIGDEIIYGEFAGFESDIDGKRYRFLEIKDVRAKISNEN